MRTINLTQGQIAIVDNDDSDLLQYKWSSRRANGNLESGWYAGRRHENKIIFLHRVIMERILQRPLESHERVDHEDLNKLNDTRDNLRIATVSQNSQNREKQSNNTSGFRGVSFDKSRSKWKANIQINDDFLYLGRFDNILDAAKAYDIAALLYHGSFARINFPREDYNV